MTHETQQGRHTAENNPIRASIQRWYEAPLLERLGARVDGLRVLERWSYRRLLEHPHEDRFSETDFVAELQRRDFRVDSYVHRFFGDFVIGVGHKD